MISDVNFLIDVVRYIQIETTGLGEFNFKNLRNVRTKRRTLNVTQW